MNTLMRVVLEDAATKLGQAANGGLKTPGQADRIGDCKRVMREVRDTLRELLEDTTC